MATQSVYINLKTKKFSEIKKKAELFQKLMECTGVDIRFTGYFTRLVKGKKEDTYAYEDTMRYSEAIKGWMINQHGYEVHMLSFQPGSIELRLPYKY